MSLNELPGASASRKYICHCLRSQPKPFQHYTASDSWCSILDPVVLTDAQCFSTFIAGTWRDTQYMRLQARPGAIRSRLISFNMLYRQSIHTANRTCFAGASMIRIPTSTTIQWKCLSRSFSITLPPLASRSSRRWLQKDTASQRKARTTHWKNMIKASSSDGKFARPHFSLRNWVVIEAKELGYSFQQLDLLSQFLFARYLTDDYSPVPMAELLQHGSTSFP